MAGPEYATAAPVPAPPAARLHDQFVRLRRTNARLESLLGRVRNEPPTIGRDEKESEPPSLQYMLHEGPNDTCHLLDVLNENIDTLERILF